jgi:hypothetical protein
LGVEQSEQRAAHPRPRPLAAFLLHRPLLHRCPGFVHVAMAVAVVMVMVMVVVVHTVVIAMPSVAVASERRPRVAALRRAGGTIVGGLGC